MNGISAGGPILLALALAIIWLSCSLYVARTTSLRTNVRYLHAILSFPIALLLIPAGVLIAKALVPELADTFDRIPELGVVSPDGRRHFAELSSIALAAPLPAFLFWRYRRLMDRRDQRALERFRGERV